ncbi:(2Fe-2S)-binding protein [Amycolatopsis sp. H20-H5]|uniref:(2Fe-2S)-binding protein n=1 Tax=Amycolatopsis sp. H20-H5 TaxID=3046309 RepID=UPI002DB5DEBC|nr:(2Fe-2S)-binding protein [Amycolatopsis sp. H20-H5]MEC3976367.1 (2Fe-2S)-binding protein [Amycolatopsis sp. H20-H5]
MTSATLLGDPTWVKARIGGAAKLYGCARPEVLGTIWWYSLSSVLVAPSLESLVNTGTPQDPSLDAITLDVVADGRFTGAHSSRDLPGGLGELGKAFAGTLGTAIDTIASVSGANPRALGAIATDSIGNRLLWTNDPERAMTLAEPLVAAIDLGLPKPRFVHVGRTPAVRRASCCLIYEAGNPKCTSCPRQTPAERDRRLRAALG